jgi:hypothetical protein
MISCPLNYLKYNIVEILKASSNVVPETGPYKYWLIVKMTDDDAVRYRLWHKSVRMPTFNGTEGDFQIFWVRYRAYRYAKVHDFARSLVNDPDLPSSNTVLIDEATPEWR